MTDPRKNQGLDALIGHNQPPQEGGHPLNSQRGEKPLAKRESTRDNARGSWERDERKPDSAVAAALREVGEDAVKDYRESLTGDERLPNAPYREDWVARWFNAAVMTRDGTYSDRTNKMSILIGKGWTKCTYQDFPEMLIRALPGDTLESDIAFDSWVLMKLPRSVWDRQQGSKAETALMSVERMNREGEGLTQTITFGND